MCLKDISTDNVITVQANDSIDRAIQLMDEHHVRHLVVVQDGKPVGIVSTGDVLASVGGVLSPERVSIRDATVPYAGPTVVEEIMSTDVVTLPPEEPLTAAGRLMLERGIAAVVLVTDEELVGIVTITDYLRRFYEGTLLAPDACRHRPVGEIMTTEMLTAAPDENVFALIRDMGRWTHHLPVVEDGQLVGILSDHDIRKALALDSLEKILEPETHIRLTEHFNALQIMTRDVQTTTPGATLAEAAEGMIENNIGALVVIEAGGLVGIITASDILRACITALEH